MRMCGEFRICAIDPLNIQALIPPPYWWRPLHRRASSQAPAVDSEPRVNVRPVDRVIAAICAAWIRSIRLLRCAIVLKPSTIMSFHRSLVRRKYRWLFTPKRGGKSGPKGPSPELVAAILEMKSRNPRFGCRRIAQQLAFTFGVEIDKDVVRRVLAKHHRPGRSNGHLG
jgi:hypothetical protein